MACQKSLAEFYPQGVRGIRKAAEPPAAAQAARRRNPQGVYYGGTICAPVIRDIFSNVLPYLGIGHNS